MIEIWEPIKDFENIYEISNLGKVRNIKNNKLKETWIDNFGYLCVSLYKNNKKYNRKLARLLAETFIPNPENKPQVNHINGDKTDNRVENLEWCTCMENIQHSIKMGLVDTEKRRNIMREIGKRNKKYKKEVKNESN